jgi:alpha-methylacyl-CoA racemase
MDRSKWPMLKEKLAAVFRTKTRAEWNAIMEHSDVCYAPVLRMSEAAQHPHNRARGTFVDIGGDTRAVLADWGVDAARIDALVASGAAKQS